MNRSLKRIGGVLAALTLLHLSARSRAGLGVPAYDFAPNIGLVAPTGTPAAIVARMSQEIAKAVKSPEASQRG